MTTIKELREKLQGEKKLLRSHYWGYNWLYRKWSIYVTYLLSYTKISANQISMLVIIFGVTASYLAYIDKFYFAITFAYLNLLFDGVDGEIARLRGVFSLKGVYLDTLNHLIIPALFLIALSLNLNITLGLFGALAWSLMKATGKLENKIFFGAYLGNEARYDLPANTETFSNRLVTMCPNQIRRFLGIRYQIREYLIALIIFLIANILGVLPQTVFAYSLFLILHYIEEMYRGYFSIEKKVRSLGERLK